MKYYVIAGEASGDLHGGKLLHELSLQDPQAAFRGFGGDLMEAAGLQLQRHYREMSFMGIWEVVKNLSSISKFLKQAQQDILSFKPDVLILIDYPGFNLRMAKFAKQHGFKVVYYISPKLWAWKESRVEKIKAYVDLLLLILPFEKDFYKKHHFERTAYVGNPVVDAVRDFTPEQDFRKKHGLGDKPLIALLPGSRLHELEHMLPLMLGVVPHFPEHEFVIAKAPGMDDPVYGRLLHGFPVKAVKAHTYDLLNNSTAALVTSGTATLETALFEVPQVVCYKISAITYAIGKQFVKINLYSLPNIIAGREIIRELIQSELTIDNMVEELKAALPGGSKHAGIKAAYAGLKKLLGNSQAAKEAAGQITGFLKG